MSTLIRDDLTLATFNSPTLGLSDRTQRTLDSLALWDNPKPIRSEDEYDLYLARSNALCSLSCYTFNTKHLKDSFVWELEAKYNQLIYRWNSHLLIKDRDTVFLANYALARKHFVDFDTSEQWAVIFKELVNRGAMFKSGETNHQNCIDSIRRKSHPVKQFVIIGLRKKIGNNLFTQKCNGQQQRQYLTTASRQMYSLEHRAHPKDATFKALVEICNLVPELPNQDRYTMHYLGDGKGAVRFPGIHKKDYRRLQSILNSTMAHS